jgi:hypothetical protein
MLVDIPKEDFPVEKHLAEMFFLSLYIE